MARSYKRDKIGRFAGGGGVIGGIRRATGARKQRKTNKRIKNVQTNIALTSDVLRRGGHTGYRIEHANRTKRGIGKGPGTKVPTFSPLTPSQRRHEEKELRDFNRDLANLRTHGSYFPPKKKK